MRKSIFLWTLYKPKCLNVCVSVGSERRLCHHHHGPVLVYRVYAPGCNCHAASCPIPYDGHHDGWQGAEQSHNSVRCHKKTFDQLSVTGILLHHFGVSSFQGYLCVNLLGEHRVPKGLKHAVHWWALGGYRGGKLEPAQAHCPASPAAGWCSSLPVREPLCLV